MTEVSHDLRDSEAPSRSEVLLTLKKRSITIGSAWWEHDVRLELINGEVAILLVDPMTGQREQVFCFHSVVD